MSYILLQICLYFSPKFCSKSLWNLIWTELRSSWRRIHWKFHVNSEGIVFMSLEKAGNNKCLIYFYRLCLYFSPKFYSKSLWNLTWTELQSSRRRIHWKFHVNSEEIVLMSLEKTGNNQCLIYFYRFVFIFLPNSTVKACETWYGQSYGHPEEESIGSFMSTLKELY